MRPTFRIPNISLMERYQHCKPQPFLMIAMVLSALCGACSAREELVQVSGELKEWHKVTLTLKGPFARETDTAPNPFTDYRMDVRFMHESGSPSYTVPGYFAADGNAGETSADSGDRWRAHLAPDKQGKWSYRIAFTLKGQLTEWDGIAGSFEIGRSDKSGRDLRGKGRLQYVGERYLKFAGSGEYFLKAGADAPETLLAFADFDGTYSGKEVGVHRKGEAVTSGLKTWEPHVGDWREGDPTWQDGKGKGLIGAINYLASTGCNAFSFLTYNAGGDGDNVWPHLSRDDKLRMDCSKLDQWEIVFSHASSRGMYLHFKLQETENDDLRNGNLEAIKQALDAGETGPERKLYLRELVARFGHHLALNWNLGEENTQSLQQLLDMVHYLREIDAYGHHMVLHTYPRQQEEIYSSLLGNKSALSGLSIQNNDVSSTHSETVSWVRRSADAGLPWVVAHDEAGNASTGTPPDPDYPGMAEAAAGLDPEDAKQKLPTLGEIRGEVLWGNLLGGGGGVEYYFGYKLPQNDLAAEDWRSRSRTWRYSAIALDFFRHHSIPFWRMENVDALVRNPDHDNRAYCFAQVGLVYVVYLTGRAERTLDLSDVSGNYRVGWFNPRDGGELHAGSIKEVSGGVPVDLGIPPGDPSEDWVVVVRSD